MAESRRVSEAFWTARADAVVAAAALWLLEDATMTSGQVIPVDGGLGHLRTGA